MEEMYVVTEVSRTTLQSVVRCIFKDQLDAHIFCLREEEKDECNTYEYELVEVR